MAFSGCIRENQMIPLNLPHPPPLICGDVPPVDSTPAGYAALIAQYGLVVPPLDEFIAIGDRHTYRQEGRWRVLTPRYRPADTVVAHLEFALKNQGVDLAVLNAL